MKAFVIILPLLGLTWVIGLLAVNPYTTVFAWIFLFLNAFQVYCAHIHTLLNSVDHLCCTFNMYSNPSTTLHCILGTFISLFIYRIVYLLLQELFICIVFSLLQELLR